MGWSTCSGVAAVVAADVAAAAGGVVLPPLSPLGGLEELLPPWDLPPLVGGCLTIVVNHTTYTVGKLLLY